MENLKPCPFCGSTDLIREPYYDESTIRCQQCKCEGPTSTYDELDENWNKRPGEVRAEAAGAAQAVVVMAERDAKRKLNLL